MTPTQDQFSSLADFFESGRRVHYSKSELIIAGDHIDPDVYFVERGYVKVYSIDDDGEEYLHIIYKSGEIFPLIWALKARRRRVFYEAMSKCTLLKVSRDKFLERLAETDDVFLRQLLMQLADQFNIYADRIDNLQYKSAYQRVVYRLLFLASRFGIKKGKKIIIDAPLTHKAIAQSVNLARESVSRELEKLTEYGLISHASGKIIINDVSRLAEEFSEPTAVDLWGLR